MKVRKHGTQFGVQVKVSELRLDFMYFYEDNMTKAYFYFKTNNNKNATVCLCVIVSLFGHPVMR